MNMLNLNIIPMGNNKKKKGRKKTESRPNETNKPAKETNDKK